MNATNLFRAAIARTSWRTVTQSGSPHLSSTSSAQLGGVVNESNSETSTAPISSKAWEDLIREIRFNTLSENALTTIQHLQRPLPEIRGIKPTLLYSFLNHYSRPSTKELNNTFFQALPGPTFTFFATDKLRYTPGEYHTTGLALHQGITKLRRCPSSSGRLCERLAPRRLELKSGTQVVLLASIDGLSKGARGVVTGFKGIDRDEYEADKKAGCAVPPLRYFCRRTQRCEDIVFPIRVPMVAFHALGKGVVAKRVYPSYPLQGREEFCAPEGDIRSVYAEFTRWQIPLRHAWAMSTKRMKKWGVDQIDYAKVDVRECLRKGRYQDEVLACVKGPEGIEVVGNLDVLSTSVLERGRNVQPN